MKVQDTKSQQLNFTDAGAGKVIVLLHGFLEDSTMWDFILKEIATRNRVVCIDLPGHGRSKSVSGVCTMDQMANSIIEILNNLRIEKFSLVGHSMGGYVSLAIADLYPQRVEKLMLFYSTANADSNEKKQSRLQAVDLVRKNHISFVRHAIPMLFRPKSRTIFRNEINALKLDAAKMSSESISASLRGMRIRPDRSQILKKVDLTVFFVSGKYDPAVPLESLKNQHAMTGVKKVVLTDNGHMGHIEDEEECREAILDFVNYKS